MPVSWKSAVAVVALGLAVQAWTPAVARAPMSQAQVAAEQKDVEAGIAWIDYLLDRAAKGDLIVSARGADDPNYTSVSLYLPVNRDLLIWAAQRSVFEGEMTAADAAAMLIVLGRLSGEKVRGLRNKRADLVRRKAELAALASRPAAPVTPPPLTLRQETQTSASGCDGFAGTWNTNYGPMWLGAAGGGVNGSYEWNSAYGTRTDSLSGSVSGSVATGTYTQPGYPEPLWRSGKFTFTLSSDGQSWSGSGTNADGSASMGWNGTCAGAPAPRTSTEGPKN